MTCQSFAFPHEYTRQVFVLGETRLHCVLTGSFILAEEGDRFEKDGVVYEYKKDPVTGKLIKKVVGAKKAVKKGGRGTPEGLTEKELKDYKKGKRNNDSDSEYSYTSHVSAGGTRHVQRRRKREDGTYSAAQSYHSSQDEEGEARRRQRRRDRRHANSAHSYYSVVSEGGTRHTKRRRRRDDGTYSASEIYESPDENDVGNSRMNFLATDKEFNFGPNTKKNVASGDEDSEYSYYSERSEGGTRYEFKRKVLRDIRGNKVGYGTALPHNDADTDGASLRPRIGSFTGETLDAEEYANRRLKPIARADSMVKQFLTDVNTLPQEEPEDGLWPGASEPGDHTEGAKTADDRSDLSTKTDEELQRERERQEKRKQMQKNIDLANERRRKREQEKLERLERQRQKEEEEAARRREMELSERRKSVISERSGRAGTPREKPKSMVTYERGPGREATNPSMKTDNRDIGLSHDNWGANGRRKSYVGKQHGEKQDDPSRVKSRREIRDLPTFNKLPSINPLKGIPKDRRGSNISNIGGKVKTKESDEEDKSKEQEKQDENQQKKKAEDMFEYDKDGNIRLKGGVKAIDLDNLTDDDLRRMGIDPRLSKAEIARKLKEKFGKDLMIQDGGKAVGTRRLEDYDKYQSIMELANDPNFDVSSVRGPKRMNILFTRGGQILVEHMKRVLVESTLRRQDYAHDLDERDSSIDFLNHYRLVDPGKLEGYAKAFVVEDGNLDTVINYTELRVALEGIVSIEEMTKKQMDYVLKVLHIDDSTQLTFRMFAVITALCERVTMMDPVARHLLDICNLADIERKLDLYNAMFYHNVQSDRDPNHITSESLKIELMAGGLNWGQQQFIMKQMEPNSWGEISFLDYICYIPLFMSMHDNICDNPLDMSDRKYTMPPRKRPPSTQRDMNPLGSRLSKNSTYLLRKQALDLMAGKLDTSGLQAEKIELLNRYAARCPVVMPYSRQSTNASDHFDQHSDLIF